jgi:hypothetical protein
MTRYKYLNNFKNKRKNKNHDYKKTGEIFKKNISPAFYMSETLSLFLDQLSTLFVGLLENVKRINKTYMYSVDKDESEID